MKLRFDHYGDNGFPLIILHGLFGSASNFRSLAKLYGEKYSVYCLDLRNHGESPHGDDSSYDAMASDILEFMDDHNMTSANILGHSMGGKVAMQLALSHPDRVNKLIVGDIAPVTYPPNHTEVFDGLNALDLNAISSRGEAETVLKNYISNPGVRLFLLSNLARKKDQGFYWRMNLPVLEHEYDQIAAAPRGAPFEKAALFIRGELSEYIPESFYPAIRELFPNARIETLAGAGHWLHAEKPQEFTKLVMDFLED
ncbi:alpha/beta fold hydrolase [Emcibacter sp.]|uniref:alpha/beta fold hydrolase n=1 Tax=Emcibacter sp. TaxID=1979954 RepID=UPI002AA6A150|nr:alpha/beta fold hydrolase [Emcibacter sp.]